MIPEPDRRPLQPAETLLITRLLDSADLHAEDPLRQQCELAYARRADWTSFLDLGVETAGAVLSPLPDGPVSGRLLVLGDAGEPTGEILVWIAGGLLAGLEYAWYTDEPPTAWPAVDHLAAL